MSITQLEDKLSNEIKRQFKNTGADFVTRTGDLLTIDDVDISIVDIPANIVDFSNSNGNGYLLQLDNDKYFYIENLNYYLELSTMLDETIAFLDLFSAGSIIGSNGAGAVIVDAGISNQATVLKNAIESLKGVLP